jgi:outer membrane protein, heavy metal efflux system
MRTLPLLLGFAAAFLNPLASGAQAPAPVLTLPAALDLAASRSPAVSAARRSAEAAEGAIRQAGARRNPTLNASVEDFRRETRTTTATIELTLEPGG